MCGLVYVKRRNGSAVKALIKRFNFQRTRGLEGFGYIAVKNGRVDEVVRSETEEGILSKLKEENSNEILFHHRMPTSTPNFWEATHPIVVKNDMLEYDYHVIHNGVITNPEYCRTKHIEMGFEYTTEYQEYDVIEFKNRKRKDQIKRKTVTKFNDSEALAIDLALVLDGKKEELNARGSIAFILYRTKKNGEIVDVIFGHNSGNPLFMEGDPKSDMFSLKSASKGRPLETNVFYRLDYKTNEITQRPFRLEYQYTGNTSMGFGSHNTREYVGNTEYGKSPVESPLQLSNGKLTWKEEEESAKPSMVGSWPEINPNDFTRRQLGNSGVEVLLPKTVNIDDPISKAEENMQKALEEMEMERISEMEAADGVDVIDVMAFEDDLPSTVERYSELEERLIVVEADITESQRLINTSEKKEDKSWLLKVLRKSLKEKNQILLEMSEIEQLDLNTHGF